MHQKQCEALKSKMQALQAQQQKTELERAEESDGLQRQLGALQASRCLALTTTPQDRIPRVLVPSIKCIAPATRAAGQDPSRQRAIMSIHGRGRA